LRFGKFSGDLSKLWWKTGKSDGFQAEIWHFSLPEQISLILNHLQGYTDILLAASDFLLYT